MAEPQLHWSKSKHRTIKSSFSYADGSKEYRSTRHRTKEKWAHENNGTFKTRGYVKSNGLRQIEAVFYCDGSHGCEDVSKPGHFMKTFDSAMFWVQWRYEMCCAKQVEHHLANAPDDEAGLDLKR